MSWKLLGAVASIVATATFAGTIRPAVAEYPDKPIKIIVPFGAGGATSSVTQLLTQPLEKVLGTKVVIINKGGGGGKVGSAAAARAKADGYTLLMTSSGPMAVGWQTAKAGYSPADFDFLGRLCTVPIGFAVKKGSPITSLKQLVGEGKTRELKFATPGVGSSAHLEIERFAATNGMKVKPLSSRGGKTAVRKLLSGEVSFIVVSGSNYPSLVKKGGGGVIELIGMATSKRWKHIPQAPTAKEQGYDWIAGFWWGLAVPKGVPADRLAKLRAAVAKVGQDPKTAKLYEKFYFSAAYMPAGAFTSFVSSEAKRYGKELAKLGLLKK
jgi:tripartite-type tricarboxylate transporter receptor subunit TctC